MRVHSVKATFALTLATLCSFTTAVPQLQAQHTLEAADDTAPSQETTSPASPSLPITALTFSSSAGPKHCRGHLTANVTLPRPSSQYTTGNCYDLPLYTQCGIFIGAKEDACEARLYSMPGCPESPKEMYVNTVAFVPEESPRSGLWRSMLIRCGVVVDEAGIMRTQAALREFVAGKVKTGKTVA